MGQVQRTLNGTINPIQPVNNPVEPVNNPVEPVYKPLEPIKKPVEPVSKPPEPPPQNNLFYFVIGISILIFLLMLIIAVKLLTRK